MAGHERRRARADTRARDTLIRLGKELRLARMGAGLSQADVAKAAAAARSSVGRIEQGIVRGVPLHALMRLFAAVGLAVVVKTYPDGDPVRDAPQLGLIARFRALLPSSMPWRTEVPLPIPGDQRAWDGMSVVGDEELGVEAETHIADSQAVIRRVQLKQRDGRVARVVLVVADTKHNRAAVETAA
ncbi:MAG: helix-turn-helix transcriptional regulator, partial [Candidatus Limnocylindrales bacterium]